MQNHEQEAVIYSFPIYSLVCLLNSQVSTMLLRTQEARQQWSAQWSLSMSVTLLTVMDIIAILLCEYD